MDPQPDGTCAACGNRVGEYARAGAGRRWEHKRGVIAGSPNAANAGVAATRARVANRAKQTERIQQLEAALELEMSWHERDMMAIVIRIENKLDQLLARPAGSWVPNHRRLADGGEPVRKQRRRARRAAETPVDPTDWRMQRQERPKPVPA